jgi:hypothetical protein
MPHGAYLPATIEHAVFIDNAKRSESPLTSDRSNQHLILKTCAGVLISQVRAQKDSRQHKKIH